MEILELKATITEMKNSLNGFNSRLVMAKKSDNIKLEQQKLYNREIKRKILKNKKSFRDLYSDIKQSNTFVIGDPEEEVEKEAEKKYLKTIWGNLRRQNREFKNKPTISVN